MDHLGVELDAVDALVVGHGSQRDRLTRGEDFEARRHLLDAVAVAHPDRHRVGQTVQQASPQGIARLGAARAVTDHSVAELPFAGVGHPPTKVGGDRLHAVADAQDGQAALVDISGRARRALVVHGGGTAREDEALGVERLHTLPRRRVRQQLAVDVLLAHPPGDEHARLPAEIDDDNGLVRFVRLRSGVGRAPWRSSAASK